MQITVNQPSPSQTPKPSLARNLGYFLIIPLSALVIIAVALAVTYSVYQAQHTDRVYTGVSVWGVDLSEQTREEAIAALETAFPYPNEKSIVFSDPTTERIWELTPYELGISFDAAASVDKALAIGRGEDRVGGMKEQWNAWYYGVSIAPIVMFNEAAVDAAIGALAEEIDRPAVDAELVYSGSEVSFTVAQTGRSLDRANARARLLNPLANLRSVNLELLVHATQPAVLDASQSADAIDMVLSGPVSFYLAAPLGDDDLGRVELSVDQLTEWLRIETVTTADNSLSHHVFIDENGLRHWLAQFSDDLYREPQRARYYFDDPTQELVLVEPHINGRELDIEGTIQAFNAQVGTPNRSVELVMTDILPLAHSEAKAVDLGITELLQQQTTYFYGSSPERKHNIARAAANFYGIVVGPGEEFSFNHFLGDVSEEEGFETGLIILGGRTVEGVGGGVCQVSTNIYQAAFWAGFPVKERLEHGYQVGYYNDGAGTGMDATVFSPLVDFKFLNNTPYHLLIENYYNEVEESLTIKMYSTSLGRTVEKAEFSYENVQEARPDVWEFNPELEPGEVKQVDWAVEGADVSVRRLVYNADGVVINDRTFVSNYIPWQNVFQYGPGAILPPGVDRDPADPTYNDG